MDAVRAALHEPVHGLRSRAGTIGAQATPGFAPPSGNGAAKALAAQRTCTYTTAAAPAVVSFVAPISKGTFRAGRRAASAAGRVVALRLGDEAWEAPAAGEAFVRSGTLEIVVSAQGAAGATLRALAAAALRAAG